MKNFIDRDKYTNLYFRDLMDTLKIQIRRSKPRTPEQNGRVERVHKTVKLIFYDLKRSEKKLEMNDAMLLKFAVYKYKYVNYTHRHPNTLKTHSNTLSH